MADTPSQSVSSNAPAVSNASTTQPPTTTTATTTKMSELRVSSAPTPKLENLDLKLQFAQMMWDGHVTNVTIDPGQLDRVLATTYRVLQRTLMGIMAPPITLANFIRVSRCLIAKRVQDTIAQRTGLEPAHFIRMSRGIKVPQPIGELLYALSPIRSTHPYDLFAPTLPARPNENIPQWWTFGENNLANFVAFISMTEDRYMHVEFPKAAFTDGRPLIFCSKHEADGMGTVRVYNDAPTPADIYLRFVHEEFFVPPPFVFEQCHGLGSQTLEISHIIQEYVSSYVKGSFS